MRLRHVIGASALAMLATSCSLGDSSDTTSINVYVAVDKTTLPRDEAMTITVTARNVGYGALTLTGPSDCLLYVEVLNTRGEVVWNSFPGGGCSGGTVTETIEPGLDKVQSFAWNGSGLSGARLEPGPYLIKPVARVTGLAYAGPPLSVQLE